MKSIITIALLLSAIFSGYGQRQKGEPADSTFNKFSLGEVGAQNMPYYRHPDLPAADTVAVFFLASDTAHRTMRGLLWIAFDSTTNTEKIRDTIYDYGIRNSTAFIIKGYVARERQPAPWSELSNYSWMEPVHYLDADKKQLPKTYIIWQTQPRPDPANYSTTGRLTHALDSIEKILFKTKRKP